MISAPTARFSMAPATRVGQGSSEKLRNGDRIKFGLYEIEVTIDEDAEGAAPDRGRSLASLRPDDVAMREPAAVALRHSPLQ